MVEKIGLSQRKACAVASCNRKTYRRVLRLTDDAALRQRLCDLAAERRRFGYRRLNVLLLREGIVANHKRIYQVYAAAKLQVRKRVKRRVALGRGEAITAASQRNALLSLDFVHDTLQNGRRIRILNVVDDFTRESIAIEVDTSIAGARVARVLDRIANERGAYPQTLVMDNGPELTSLAACVVVTDSRTNALYRAGQANAERVHRELNGKFRDECLNDNIFSSLAEACNIIESWRFDYNHFRPHQSLGHRTPNEFGAAHSPSSLSLRS